MLHIFVKLSQYFHCDKYRLRLWDLKAFADILVLDVQKMMIYVLGMSQCLTKKQGQGLYKHHDSTIKMMANRQKNFISP